MADRDVARNDGDGRAVERSGGAADDWQQPEPSLRIRDKVAGFGVTFLEMFKRPFTEEYPDKGKYSAAQPRFHGRHQLNRHPDGLEKCIGCELCAWACPADAIYVEGADNTEEERFSPGERYGRVYQINYLRCIFCGLCIEACPTRALTMTNEYELAGPSRAGLIYEKKDLLGPLLPGMLPAPHPMVPGTTEKDYYRGSVTESVPEQLEWVAARRDPAEDVSTEGARSESGHAGAAVARDTARPVASGVTTDVAPGHPQEGAHR